MSDQVSTQGSKSVINQGLKIENVGKTVREPKANSYYNSKRGKKKEKKKVPWLDSS